MDFTTEEGFLLPSTVVCHSVGFTLDAGGSVTKVIYRSKRDYNKSVAINANIPEGKGFLRMAHFYANQPDKLIDFLEKECDIDHDVKEKCIFTTGLHSEWFESQLMDRLGISVFRGFELDYMMKALRFLIERHPLEDITYPEDEEAINNAQRILKCYTSLKELGDQYTKGGMLAQVDEFKANFSKREDMPSSNCSMTPFLLSQLGSALGIHKIENDWSYNMVEVSPFCGRSFMGLSTAICGEQKSYDELMELATKGDSSNVDLYPADFKMGKSNDIYDEISEAPYFMFGKPAFTSTDGFTKADLMASWVNAMSASLASYTHLVGLAHGIGMVIMTGGFCNSHLARKQITKHWHSRILHAQGKKIGLHFLKNGQFLAALGAYLQAVDDIHSKAE